MLVLCLPRGACGCGTARAVRRFRSRESSSDLARLVLDPGRRASSVASCDSAASFENALYVRRPSSAKSALRPMWRPLLVPRQGGKPSGTSPTRPRPSHRPRGANRPIDDACERGPGEASSAKRRPPVIGGALVRRSLCRTTISSLVSRKVNLSQMCSDSSRNTDANENQRTGRTPTECSGRTVRCYARRAKYTIRTINKMTTRIPISP